MEVSDWPTLDVFKIDPESVSKRRSFVGGSDANIIFGNDGAKLRTLWEEKRGERQCDDLSGNLAVALGCWTEPFNRQWYEGISGRRVESVGAHLTCAKHQWRQCTLDGVVRSQGAIWEAKHTNAFAKPEEVLERYMPQLQHNMAVAKCDHAVLSVIFGNHKYEMFEIASDWLYQLELLDAERDFWNAVQTGREPVPVQPPAPPKPIGTREICLEGNNEWASAAFDWLAHRSAAKLHASATTIIKGLVEDDVSRAFGHGIEARRSKSGAISIRELAL